MSEPVFTLRLDFTERLLAQSRDRIALKPDSP